MRNGRAAVSRALLILKLVDLVAIAVTWKLGRSATMWTFGLIGYGLIVFDGFFVLPKEEYAKRRVEYLGFGVVLTFLLFLTYVKSH